MIIKEEPNLQACTVVSITTLEMFTTSHTMQEMLLWCWTAPLKSIFVTPWANISRE